MPAAVLPDDWSKDENPTAVLKDVLDDHASRIDIGGAGPQGPAGEDGEAGPPGPRGADGAPGAAGATGAVGAQGPRGVPGEDGADGEAGPPGPPGPRGADGAAGATGATGPMGPPGADGEDGITGPRGFTGERGPQGERGPPGEDGADGEPGPIGPQGPQGPQGATGPAGSGGGSTAFMFLEPDYPDDPPVVRGQVGDTGPSGVTKGSGTSVACGDDITTLVLSSASSTITGVSLTTVMTVTGVGVGSYRLSVQLIYQTTATTTGIDVAVNHTGTTTQWLMEHRFSSTGGAAATAAASEAAAAATGNLYESQGNRTKNTRIGAGTVSVDAANTDMMSTIEGFFVVSVSGSLEVKLAAEAAGLSCTARIGSNLVLTKLS